MCYILSTADCSTLKARWSGCQPLKARECDFAITSGNSWIERTLGCDVTVEYLVTADQISFFYRDDAEFYFRKGRNWVSWWRRSRMMKHAEAPKWEKNRRNMQISSDGSSVATLPKKKSCLSMQACVAKFSASLLLGCLERQREAI